MSDNIMKMTTYRFFSNRAEELGVDVEKLLRECGYTRDNTNTLKERDPRSVQKFKESIRALESTKDELYKHIETESVFLVLHHEDDQVFIRDMSPIYGEKKNIINNDFVVEKGVFEKFYEKINK